MICAKNSFCSQTLYPSYLPAIMILLPLFVMLFLLRDACCHEQVDKKLCSHPEMPTSFLLGEDVGIISSRHDTPPLL